MSTEVFVSVYALVMAASLAGAVLVPAVLAGSAGAKAAAGSRGLGGPIALAIGFAFWFGITSAVAAGNGYSAGASARWGFPLVGLGLVVPVVLAVAAIWLIPSIRSLVGMPAAQPLLIAVESYRVIAGGVFLGLMFLNQLPAVFAIPAGAGDVLIGVTAFWAAASLRAGRVGPAMAWNVLGVLDLVVAVSLGVTTTPGPLHLIGATPSSGLLSVLPLVLVPTFLVPLSFLIHVVSMRHLLGRRRQLRAVPSLGRELSA
jgi:hypothetical protein